MHHTRYSIFLLATLTIISGGLIGCAQDNLVNPGLDIGQQTDVQSATQAVTIAAPSAAAAESMIVGLMSLVSPTRAPGDPMCPAIVDLGNGITGSCSTAAGEATFTFGGTLMVDGASAVLNGTLAVNLAASQPATGTAYSIVFDATVSGPRGDASWSTIGTVTVDAGNVIDIDFVMTMMATSASGFSSTVTAIVDMNRFELVVNGPLGGVLRFQLDRNTMTGQVLLNGIPVADVTIVGGCATIQYTLPGVPDRVVCSDD